MKNTITIANLAAYNDGEYRQITITLPADEQTITEAFKQINAEEIIIIDADLKYNLEVSDYTSVKQLNEVIHELDYIASTTSLTVKQINAYIEENQTSVADMSQLDTLRDMQNTLYIPVTSKSNLDYQVGLYIVYNNVWDKLAGLSQDIKNYLDYELIGHDYMCSHSVITYLE